MKSHKVVVGAFVLLGLASLACSRAGQILTPAEATAEAEALKPGIEIIDSSTIESGPKVNDVITVTGSGFLVNLRKEPGGGISGSVGRGAEVTILEIAQTEGEYWYKISSDAGEGWIGIDNIDENLSAAESGGEGEDAGIKAGDTVYATGIGFLVNIVDEPGSANMIGGLPRNAPMVVLEVARLDDTLWYHIDSDAGEGWLAEENILTEAP